MRLPSRVELDRDFVRRVGLYAFLQLAWHLIEPGKVFIGGWHLRLICRCLEAVSRGLLRKLIINIPPGMGKSTLICVAWPAWDWIENPGRKFFFCSYSQKLARRDSEKTHKLVCSDWYQERWPARVDHSRTETQDDWSTTAGGQRYCTTTNGQATGWHPDIKCADDPNPPKDAIGGKAVTKAALAAVAEFWTGTMGSRGEPGVVAEVIVQQRVHEADLSGVLLEAGDYVHLRLPMEYEADNPCSTPFGADPRTIEGELLCEERRGREAVIALKRSLLTPSNVAAQLQQRPQAKSGGTFQRAWFKRYIELPKQPGLWLQAWDCNYGDNDNPDKRDPVCGTCWVLIGSDVYLVDLDYGRYTFLETLDHVAAFRKKWPRVVKTVIERKANGAAVVSTFKRRIPGFIAVDNGNKATRAHTASAVWQAGNGFVPLAAPWAHDFIEEHVGWPFLKLDNRVDSACHGICALVQSDMSGYADFVNKFSA